MYLKSVPVLVWVFIAHLASIYLFTRGFLLTRLALPDINPSSPNSTLPPKFSRAVILIIDALRFDFISPNPPEPVSPYYHDVLSLPAKLTAAHPERSAIFYAFADPPTTTLQRIKGITTGSLPTFVDMGSNFGGQSILEDSIIQQLRNANKTIAFMGDDTWMSVFPTSFAPNMTHPFDSFNVEDLHTVDNGVTQHLIPLLSDPSPKWDLILGHFLGVDHVGHRLGPSHPTMTQKLLQMNDVLTRVVDLLDDDTLLVLMGDHGMDTRGDHGGDGELETGAGVWVYSKKHKLVHTRSEEYEELAMFKTFPGANVPHRHIQQIDLVPTLSLLLGLPIPFNNLGSVILEFFWNEGRNGNSQRGGYEDALKINANQIKRYLDTYRASSAGGELDADWPGIMTSWEQASSSKSVGEKYAFTRNALEVCRAMWAQFDVVLMGLGLVALVVSTLASWAVYLRLGVKKEKTSASEQGKETQKKQAREKEHDGEDQDQDQDQDEAYLTTLAIDCLRWAVLGGAAGIVFPIFVELAFQREIGVSIINSGLFGTVTGSSLAIIFRSWLSLSGNIKTLFKFNSLPIPLVLHTLSFMSNSYTFWEDKVLPFLLITTLLPSLLTALSSPLPRLRNRILIFSLIFAVCVRLIAISTVCREEQQPYCHVTFYASSAITSPPGVVLFVIMPVSLGLSAVAKTVFLGRSKSDNGIANILLPSVFPIALGLSSAVWVLEWVESSEVFGTEWGGSLRLLRTVFAWAVVGLVLVVAAPLWYLIPISLKIDAGAPPTTTSPGTNTNVAKKKEVTVLGYANAFGSPYLIFWFLSFILIYLSTQLTGQVVLALGAIATLSLLEIVDSTRDVRALHRAFEGTNPSSILSSSTGAPNNKNTSTGMVADVRFQEITPLALLGLQLFYGTGHQATIPSIQWKSGFVLTPSLTYPLSPLLVILNTFGPTFLLALSTPLLALWNTPPLPFPPRSALRNTLRASIGLSTYFATLLLGSAMSSAWLRRHLMVWKVFAPRFMLAASTVVVVDLALLIGVSVGVGRVVWGLKRLFGAMPDIRNARAATVSRF
ncbi:hypothetical protein K474DRAFT_1686509 [Panus rudis PR-1116 ss-1]|nr:hypothetical protein K474DRAFT_1686509 [Panus rudis PR-1116 ss-1]